MTDEKETDNRAPSEAEISDIEDLLRDAVENAITAQEILSLRKQDPSVLEAFIEAHSVHVRGMQVVVIFEAHQGGLFQHARFSREGHRQPEMADCIGLLPYLKMPGEMENWTASWAEPIGRVVDPEHGEVDSMAWNVVSLVRPPKELLQFMRHPADKEMQKRRAREVMLSIIS